MKHQSEDKAAPKLPSDRSFGVLFGAIFIIGAGYFQLFSINKTLAIILFTAGVIFLIITMLSPVLLAPLNRAWFELGLLLGKIVNPIVLGFIFFIVITPIALIMKFAGRDALGLRRKKHVDTYWVDRNPMGPDSGSFNNQF